MRRQRLRPPCAAVTPDCVLTPVQEIFDTGIKLLPRSSMVNIMRMALRAIGVACVRTFHPDGIKAFNMYAIEKLAHNLLTIERFASRCALQCCG